MKYIITESQLNFLKEQTSSNLTTPEQTLLGFLNRFLQGEKGEFENTPVNDLKKTMLFNNKTIYPMAQKLLEKKNTGKKTMMIRCLTPCSWQWIKQLLKNKDMSSLKTLRISQT